jgi:hypothetical protein
MSNDHNDADIVYPTDDAKRQYIRGLLDRQEAVAPNADGSLPPGATHEIVQGGSEDELPAVRRRRFSAF